MQHFEKALRLNRQQPRALLEMAELSFEDRHYVPARDYYERFSQLSEQNARSLLLGMRLAKVFDDRDKAASYGLQSKKTLSRYAGISAIPVGAMMKAAHPEVVAATRTNPGETLRQARESKDWSLPEVALRLNLTVTSLTHLEAGDFDKLPGHTFARGYVRAYAKLLGMDQAALVRRSTSTPAPTARAAAFMLSAVSKSRYACLTLFCASSASCCSSH